MDSDSIISSFQVAISDNRQIIYDLINAHGDEENFIFFGTLMGDIDKVIDYYISKKDYLNSLEILKKEVTNK